MTSDTLIERTTSKEGHSSIESMVLSDLITTFMGCFKVKFGHNMVSIILSKDIELSKLKKCLFMARYIKTTQCTEIKMKKIGVLYYFCMSVVIILSAAVPAIMAFDSENRTTFWITWTFALTITILNSFIGSYKLQKEYFILNNILLQLRREGWSFLELSGYYGQPEETDVSGVYERATHDNKTDRFFARVENIKRKQFMAEFTSNGKRSGSRTNGNDTISTDSNENTSVRRRCSGAINDNFVPESPLHLIRSRNRRTRAQSDPDINNIVIIDPKTKTMAKKYSQYKIEMPIEEQYSTINDVNEIVIDELPVGENPP